MENQNLIFVLSRIFFESCRRAAIGDSTFESRSIQGSHKGFTIMLLALFAGILQRPLLNLQPIH